MDEDIKKSVNLRHAELIIFRMEQEIKSDTLKNKFKEHSLLTNLVTDYTLICADTVIDESARIRIKDAYVNILNANH